VDKLKQLWQLARLSLANSGAKTKGQWAENFAERYLELQGLSLLERNFTCRGGEIDLIMEHGEILVFVEVRGIARILTRWKPLIVLKNGALSNVRRNIY